MSSPFPGMDPWLEGAPWQDVHNRLAVAMSNQLAETIDERYIIRLEPAVVESEDPDDAIRLLIPNVAISTAPGEPPPRPEQSVAVLSPRVTIPALEPITVRVSSVRIRLAEDQSLVTSIEIVSPANKFGESFEKFRSKWRSLRAAGVHLVEVDLIRRGRRIFDHESLRTAHYALTVTKAGSASTGAWPFSVREPIPPFPVPLRSPDPDAAMALQPIFEQIYRQGRYQNSIDYASEPPPPGFSPEDREWLRERITAARSS